MTEELNYSKIIKKLEKEKQKNESSISKKNDLIESLHIDIKKLSDNKKYLSKSILLLSSNPIKSISFIYKKESKNKYIKARFYWNKKQREVQIGSIKKTLDVIKSKYLSKQEIISLDFSKLNKWDVFSKNKLILSSLNSIATIKIKRYIFSKINKTTLPDSLYQDLNVKTNNPNDSTNNNSNSASDDKTFNKDWYSSWGDRN